MTFIPPERIKRADVVRLVVTRNSNGDVIDESYTQVYGDHRIDLQPATNGVRISADQLKYVVSHRIYPVQNIVANIAIGDFYRIGSRLYKITKLWDYVRTGYVDVFDGAFSEYQTSSTVFKRFYSIDSVVPGTYTFGSGLFASVPSFDQAPDIVGLLVNDGSFYIDNVTTTGFRMVDRQIGVTPSATLYIWEKPVGIVDENKWSYSGVAPGTYTFGTSPFDDITTSFASVPVVMTQDNNDGSHFVTNKSITGFTIVDRHIGSVPSVTVVIIRQ